MTNRLPRHLCVALLSFVVLACSTGGDDARVRVHYSQGGQLPRELLTVTITDPVGSRTLSGPDIGASWSEGREFATATSGSLHLAFKFAGGSVVASEGAVDVPLRTDWSYDFTLSVDSLDPTRFCIGCMGHRAFPLDAAYRVSPRDSVWLVWGGNYIKNPVIY
ncbi:MAG TPA: hypothetical protein VFI52_10000 [Gemmatimonadaceae bacterium]|nr:hypothetical protein [Gemmatimonadaceae bacterium]